MGRKACTEPQCLYNGALHFSLGFVILISFPLQQWLHERDLMLGYRNIVSIVNSLRPEGSTIKLLLLAHKINFCVLRLLQKPAIAFQTTFMFGFTLQ